MYEETTDQELKDIRESIPKYLNDMTLEQQQITQDVYAEQRRRYDTKRTEEIKTYNQEVETANYKIGNKVSYFCRSFIGFGGITITGTVKKRKQYYVSLDIPFNNKKTAHLTKAWKQI